ncbi:ankyrin repeat, PH and SEC7 domain containing protein secG-like [Sycon ciliatum]|uniref:ankyrin repeat, PH and SEC7 domain containing protein secG-like n=1 Tax=Sycon ciliatum TaxID=27933 RepID=UPI0031F71E18
MEQESSKDESSGRQSQQPAGGTAFETTSEEETFETTSEEETASEEESEDEYRPPKMAKYSAHYYSTNAPHPDLVRACEDDNVEQVRQTVNIGTPTEPVTRPDLLEQVPKSYFYDPFEGIPMTIMALLILAACYYGSIHCVQFLLWCNPSLLHGKVMFNVYNEPRQDCEPVSLLHVCAFRGHKALCELLIKKGVDVNVQDKYGRTPFHMAAMKGHVSILEYLLSAGHPLEAKDSTGSTPFHFAAYGGHVSVLEHLLNAGHPLEAKNPDDETPLHYAACSGHISVVEYLLTSGHSLEPKNNIDSTPLHIAAENGHVSVAEYLLNSGHSLDPKNNHYQTKLWSMCGVIVAIGSRHDYRKPPNIGVTNFS